MAATPIDTAEVRWADRGLALPLRPGLPAPTRCTMNDHGPLFWVAWMRQISASDLRRDDRHVARALLQWADAATLRLEGSVLAIAAATGLSRRFVGLSLRRLEEAGMVRVIGGWSGGGRRTVLELQIDPEHAIAAPSTPEPTAHTVRSSAPATANGVRGSSPPTAHSVRSPSEAPPATAQPVRSSSPPTANGVRGSGPNCAPGAHEPWLGLDSNPPNPPEAGPPAEVADALAALARLDVTPNVRRFLTAAHSPGRVVAWCAYAEAEAAVGRSHSPAGLAVDGIRTGEDPPGARKAAEAAARAARRQEAIDRDAEQRRAEAEAWAAAAAEGPGRMRLTPATDDDDSGLARFTRRLAAARGASQDNHDTDTEATTCSA